MRRIPFGLRDVLAVDDGNNARAAEVAMAALVERLLPLEGEAAALLASRSDLCMRNWRGTEVGWLRAAAALRQSIAV